MNVVMSQPEEIQASDIPFGVLENESVVTDSVSIDLPAYAASYSGYIKYHRLLFIAQRCRSLRSEALKLAHDYIKTSTLDVPAYEQEEISIEENFGSDAINEPEEGSSPTVQNPFGLIYDTAWVQTTSSKVSRQREELETELKNHKANTIKECTRKGLVDMGDFCLKAGELANALKHYVRSREYCTSRQQDLKSCLNIIKVAILQGSWSHVCAFIPLAENIVANHEDDLKNGEPVLGQPTTTTRTTTNASSSSMAAKTELAIASGLAKLSSFNFQEAANHFLQGNPDQSDTDQTAAIVSSSDLAFYVTLCALATFDRNEIKSRVLGSPTFRLILESEPACRDLLVTFHSVGYTKCLSMLASVKNLLKLDVFLSGPVHTLYQRIRVKALCQYFLPFVTADLNLMAAEFNTIVTDLEAELVKLIQNGSINARIDSHKRLLCARKEDQRCQTFASALRVAEQYHRRCQAAILRYNLVRRGHTRTQSAIPYEHDQERPGVFLGTSINI